jgi:hypothetical protein
MTGEALSGTESLINYDGRVFCSAAAETAGADGAGPVGHYHQAGDASTGMSVIEERPQQQAPG